MFPIRTREDAQGLQDDVEALVEGWYPQGTRMDWDDFLWRLETRTGVDLGESMDTPAIRWVQKYARSLRRAE